LLGKVVADLDAGSEAHPLIDVGPVPRALERGVEGEVPAADGLVDDGANLPRPRVGRVDGALIPDLGRERDADRPMPAIGHADARADVVADPLHSVAGLLAGEDVEADLRPTGESGSEVQRLVV